jgi:multiple sugar transport system permease protein
MQRDQKAHGWTGRGLKRERWHGYFFIAPVYSFLGAVVLFPLGAAFWTSLLRIRGLSSSFNGLQNYSDVISDPAFWNSLRVSVLFTIVCVVLHMLFGLGLALLVNRAGRLKGILRLVFLVPWMIAPAIGATIWLWLLDPQFGVVNYLGMSIGLLDAPQAWLGVPSLALASVSAVEVWRGVPFVMLLLMAGLLGIPGDQYEAASLDGATAWQLFRHVTLPNLRALLAIVCSLDVINTVRQFDLIAVMTGGGPIDATEVLPSLIYNVGFRANHLGNAAAIGMLLLVLVLAFSSIYVVLVKPTSEEA